MIKKVFTFTTVCMFLFLLSGCRSHNYSGKYQDLYTVAIHSVLWNNGHSYGADRVIDSSIEVLEKDDFGRTMFTYYEHYYAGGELSFSTLIISQHSLNNFVYYYEDYNFLILEQESLRNTNQFSKEDREKLKKLNDWNEELNLNKCVKKEITCDKPKIPYDIKFIENKIVENFDLADKRYNLFMDYLTSDAESNFIIYGSIIISNFNSKYFAAYIEVKEDEICKIDFFVPTNIFEYRDEFITFKNKNGWIK